MRISSKGRYGIASMINIAQHKPNEFVTVSSISEKLGISKIYLEQVFSLLKRGNLVISTKGSQGGYQLTKEAKNINLYEILVAIEQNMFEKTESTVLQKEPSIERAMNELIFDKIDSSILSTLKAISLKSIVDEIENYNTEYMFFI